MKTWDEQVSDGSQRSANKKKTVKRGLCAAFQVPGLLLILASLSIGGLAAVAGLVLILLGSIIGRGWICGACGNRIEATSSLCPTCGSRLK